MVSISNLCNKGLYFKNGCVNEIENISESIKKYNGETYPSNIYVLDASIDQIEKPRICNAEVVCINATLKLTVKFISPFVLNRVIIGLVVNNIFGSPVFGYNNRFVKPEFIIDNVKSGSVKIILEDLNLHEGQYLVSIFLGDSQVDYDRMENLLSFSFKNDNFINSQVPPISYIGSYVPPKILWSHEISDND
jgi:hypothetical protein